MGETLPVEGWAAFLERGHKSMLRVLELRGKGS